MKKIIIGAMMALSCLAFVGCESYSRPQQSSLPTSVPNQEQPVGMDELNEMKRIGNKIGEQVAGVKSATVVIVSGKALVSVEADSEYLGTIDGAKIEQIVKTANPYVNEVYATAHPVLSGMIMQMQHDIATGIPPVYFENNVGNIIAQLKIK